MIVVRFGLIVILSAVLVAGVLHADLDDRFVRERSVEELGAFLAPDLIVDLPDADHAGDGPFPAVIMMPGCGGLYRADGSRKPVTFAYGEVASAEGLAVIHVDSFGRRGHDYDSALFWICPGYRFRGAARAGDVIAVLDLIRSDPRFDPERIAVAGWSHGGWAIMEALAFDYRDAWPPTLRPTDGDVLAGLSGAFLVYPYCGWPSRTADHGWPNPVPALFVLAEGDAVTPTGDCIEMADSITAMGGEASVQILAGAAHSFDEADTQPESAPKYVYDPVIEATSHALFRDFVRAIRDRRDLLPPGPDR